MTDTRAQTFAEWWNGSDASGRGRLAASDGSFYGIAQDAWLAAWSARDEEIAAKDAEIERLTRAVDDNWVSHQQIIAMRDERDAAESSLSEAQKRIEALTDALVRARRSGCQDHCNYGGSSEHTELCKRITALLSTEGEKT
jgi:hypothetical protein